MRFYVPDVVRELTAAAVARLRKLKEGEKGYFPELWQKMADLGWLGLILPEKYGGAGGSLLDLAVLLEEVGRA